MRLVAAGDEQAFRLLAERHLGRMLRLAGRMLGSGAEADDVTQEALLRLWSHAGRWRPEKARLATWLYAIVYRLCVDRLRGPAKAAALDEEIPDPAPDALAEAELAAERRRLRQAMLALPERQRAALALFYYEELSGAQAAEVMGLRLRAYWSLLDRAKQALQKLMTEVER